MNKSWRGMWKLDQEEPWVCQLDMLSVDRDNY